MEVYYYTLFRYSTPKSSVEKFNSMETWKKHGKKHSPTRPHSRKDRARIEFKNLIGL